MNELISIIVPIYRVEAYLKRCIKSICSQTYKNLEIILVDDGSDDMCPGICDEYAGKDSRIRVLHKENGGRADARNAGMDAAKGEYFIFADADDFLDGQYVENLYELLLENKADIAVCGWMEHAEEEPEKKVPALQKKNTVCWNRQEALKALLYQTPFDNAVWGKIFRRHLFDEIRMPVGMEYEDFAIVYKVFQLAGKVCYNPYQGYQYVLRQDGITLEEFSAKKMDLIELADQMKEDLMGDYPELRSAVWSRFFRANCHIYLQIPSGKQYQSERKRIEQNICLSRRYVLEDKEARRGTRGAALCTCLGFGFFRNLRKFKGAGKQ